MTLKGVGVGLSSQPLIRTGKQSELQTHVAGKDFIVRADEKLTAFIELESAVRNTAFRTSRIGGDLIQGTLPAPK